MKKLTNLRKAQEFGRKIQIWKKLAHLKKMNKNEQKTNKKKGKE